MLWTLETGPWGGHTAEAPPPHWPPMTHKGTPELELYLYRTTV